MPSVFLENISTKNKRLVYTKKTTCMQAQTNTHLQISLQIQTQWSV